MASKSTMRDEFRYGVSAKELDWKLTGLAKHPIMMRGIFALKRVCDAVEIKQGE